MLTCEELVTLVTEYLEGSMPFADRLRFRLHLGFCRDCRAFLRQMKQTMGVLGRLPPETVVPPAVQEELLGRFRDWKRQQPSG